MTMNFLEALKQLNNASEGTAVSNSGNQVATQSADFSNTQPQPLGQQGVYVEPQPNTVQMPAQPQPLGQQGVYVEPQPNTAQMPAQPQPLGQQGVYVEPQPYTAQTTIQPQPMPTQVAGNLGTAVISSDAPLQQNANSQVVDISTNNTLLTPDTSIETAKSTNSKPKKSSKKSKAKPKEEDSVYIYERDIEMPVKYCGMERFKMPLRLELTGMDEFEYIKNMLAEQGVTAAKKENFIVEEQDDYFRLIKVSREQTRYHSKG